LADALRDRPPYGGAIPAAQWPRHPNTGKMRYGFNALRRLTRSLAAPRTRRGLLGSLAALGVGLAVERGIHPRVLIHR